MKKKLIAIVLAGTMLFGGSVSVYAAGTQEINAASSGAYSQKVTVTNDITTPTIKITVPTVATVKLNPYKIKTTIDAEGGAAKVTDSTEQIVSPEYTIKNESNVKIDVNATVQGVVPATSKVVLATAKLTGKETTKSVFLYLDVEKSGGGFESAYAVSNKNQCIVGKTAVTKKEMASLADGSTAATTVKYTFRGECATTNTEAWATTDLIDISLTWSFTPVLPASPAAGA